MVERSASASAISGISRRRREALKRGGEDGLGLGEASARIEDFGKRQRREQSKASCALLLSNVASSAERLLRLRRIGRIASEQDFATYLVRWGIVATCLAALSDRDRRVDFENSLFLVFCRHFRVGKQTAEEGHRGREAHGLGLFDRGPDTGNSRLRIDGVRIGPAAIDLAEDEVERHAVLTTKLHLALHQRQ